MNDPSVFNSTEPPSAVVMVCGVVAACPDGVAIVITSPSGSESLPVTSDNKGTSVNNVNVSSDAIGAAL